MGFNFDFSAFEELVAESSAAEKAAEEKKVAKKAAKKPAKKAAEKAAEKEGVPEAVLNAKFAKQITLLTGFGTLQMDSDEEFDAERIKARLREGNELVEASAPSTIMIGGEVVDGRQLVYAALNPQQVGLASLRALEQKGSGIDVTCGGYTMHTTDTKGWPVWMRSAIGCLYYVVNDSTYSLVFMVNSTSTTLQNVTSLVGYDLPANEEEAGSETFDAAKTLCTLVGATKLPETIRVTAHGDKESGEGFLQIAYIGTGSVFSKNGGGNYKIPAEKQVETAEEKEKRLLDEAVVALPVTVELPWGGGHTQELDDDDFEGKNEVSLSTVLAKLEQTYTLLGRQVKYRAFYVKQDNLIHVEMTDSGMRTKGALCPF